MDSFFWRLLTESPFDPADNQSMIVMFWQTVSGSGGCNSNDLLPVRSVYCYEKLVKLTDIMIFAQNAKRRQMQLPQKTMQRIINFGLCYASRCSLCRESLRVGRLLQRYVMPHGLSLRSLLSFCWK